MEPLLLRSPVSGGRPWAYTLIGALLGGTFEVGICEPLDVFLQQLFDFFYKGLPLRLDLVFLFRHAEWAGLTSVGLIYGAVLGYVFQRLKGERQRVKTLHREFEVQVATLRHHYKNLAIGISGFANRVRRKFADFDVNLSQSSQKNNRYAQDFKSLEQNLTILEETSQRLNQTLSEELLFLKALTRHSLTLTPNAIYPFLKHSIKDLLGLRFQEKEIRAEINGRPLEEDQISLIFPFEPYAMDVILQSILSNAMKHGDYIQVRVVESGGRVRIEVKDNGPRPGGGKTQASAINARR